MGMIDNKIDQLSKDIDDLELFLEEHDLTVTEVLSILYHGGHIDLEQKLEEYEG